MLLRRHTARFAAALSGLMVFALLLAGFVGAVTHVGHARAHLSPDAHQGDAAASQAYPAGHHHTDSHHHTDASHVGSLPTQGSEHEQDDGCGGHATCGDLFCHGGALLPVNERASPVEGREARNDLRPAAVRSAVPTSLERPPRSFIRA